MQFLLQQRSVGIMEDYHLESVLLSNITKFSTIPVTIADPIVLALVQNDYHYYIVKINAIERTVYLHDSKVTKKY
jgi:hypothetical protein